MSRGVLLAAVLLLPRFGAAAPPASIDFGAVQLGSFAAHRLAVPAVGVSVSGPGFSATPVAGGVLVVFEPYEPREDEAGALVVRTRSAGLVRVALRGRGIDTIAPHVSIETPRAARVGRLLTIRFAANDNDLVHTCTLAVGGRTIARLTWPASSYRWRVPAGLGARTRITVTATDRSGNRASATSGFFAIRR